MNEMVLQAVVDELNSSLHGMVFGRIFQFSKLAFAIDFRTQDGRYLYINLDGSAARLYLISRRQKEIEKQSIPLGQFAQVLKKQLGGAELLNIVRDPRDRIVRFAFQAEDVAGNRIKRSLVAQLTGKSANLFILDESGFIIDSLRPIRGEAQQPAEQYSPLLHRGNPDRKPATPEGEALVRTARSISEKLDGVYLAEDARREAESLAKSKLARLRSELSKREKLKRNLENDLREHGVADEHKRVGEILLANVTTAVRRGPVVAVQDYFQEDSPVIEIPIDENSTIQEEATRRFERYSKAKRAAIEVSKRLVQVEIEIADLKSKLMELNEIISSHDEAGLASFDVGRKPTRRAVEPDRKSNGPPGVRAYRSSDGFEVLVGRSASDNDRLTFRIAGPHDLWFHAADYTGSHVIVRNPKRVAIPQKTIFEAAQIAAHFSRAKADAKVNVHYAERKFLSKPKGGAPGLVRMSSFKSLLVPPVESMERI